MIQNIKQLTLSIDTVTPIYSNNNDTGILMHYIEIANLTKTNIRYTVSIALRDENQRGPLAETPMQHTCGLVTLRGRTSVAIALGFNLMQYQEIRVYAENDLTGENIDFLTSINLWGDI